MSRLLQYAKESRIGGRMREDKRYRIVIFAIAGLTVNLLYAVYHGVLGAVYGSLWFLTLFVYYILLSVMRFSVILYDRRKPAAEILSERAVMRFAGWLLVLLSCVLAGSVYYSLVHEVARSYHKIIMISIAAYTFFKVILAIVNIVKIRKQGDLLLLTLRNIACADAAAALLTLQRSMLISFEGMSADEAHNMNAATGAAVCLLVFLMGIVMALKKSRKSVHDGI